MSIRSLHVCRCAILSRLPSLHHSRFVTALSPLHLITDIVPITDQCRCCTRSLSPWLCSHSTSSLSLYLCGRRTGSLLPVIVVSECGSWTVLPILEDRSTALPFSVLLSRQYHWLACNLYRLNNYLDNYLILLFAYLRWSLFSVSSTFHSAYTAVHLYPLHNICRCCCYCTAPPDRLPPG